MGVHDKVECFCCGYAIPNLEAGELPRPIRPETHLCDPCGTLPPRERLRLREARLGAGKSERNGIECYCCGLFMEGMKREYLLRPNMPETCLCGACDGLPPGERERLRAVRLAESATRERAEHGPVRMTIDVPPGGAPLLPPRRPHVDDVLLGEDGEPRHVRCHVCGTGLPPKLTLGNQHFTYYCDTCSPIRIGANAPAEAALGRAMAALCELESSASTSGFDAAQLAAFAMRSHRSRQQALFGAMLACMRAWADSEPDERNRWTVERCRVMLSSLGEGRNDAPPRA
jgi:hypothetical protein